VAQPLPIMGFLQLVSFPDHFSPHGKNSDYSTATVRPDPSSWVGSGYAKLLRVPGRQTNTCTGSDLVINSDVKRVPQEEANDSQNYGEAGGKL